MATMRRRTFESLGAPPSPQNNNEPTCDSSSSARSYVLNFVSATADITGIVLGAIGALNLEDGVGEALEVGAVTAEGVSKVAGVAATVNELFTGTWGGVARSGGAVAISFAGPKFLGRLAKMENLSLSALKAEIATAATAQALSLSGGHCHY